MKHLDNITIHKFRGIQNLHLQKLGQINLLVGVNNSGKTSVLEAISSYCAPLDLREWLRIARQREGDVVLRYPTIDALLWLFPQNGSATKDSLYKGEILISGSGNFPVTQLRAVCQKTESIQVSGNIRSHQKINDSVAESEDELLEIQQGLSLELNVSTERIDLFGKQEIFESFQLWENERVIPGYKHENLTLPVATVTPFSHRTEVLQARLLTEARMANFKSEVLKLLQYMDSGIIDIEILTPQRRPIIYVQHKQSGLAPLSTFGDGIRRLFFIALKLAKVKGGILLIDELEVSIHTEALQRSFNWLVEWCILMDVQLFATTHSLEAIDALLDATNEETDLVAYRLEPKDSQTNTVRLDRNLLSILREELGQEVRK